MIEHVHTCPDCKDDVLCRLDCDDMADGDNVCGPCAERNFDAIKPQEALPRERDTYYVADLGYDGQCMFGPYIESEARQRFPNDLLVKIVREGCTPLEPLYSYNEEPKE